MSNLSPRGRREASAGRAARLCVATIAALAALAVLTATVAGAGIAPRGSGWTAPAPLPGCDGAAAPQVGFPAAAPAAPVGPGAVVCAGAGGVPALAPIVGGVVSPARPLRLAASGRAPAPSPLAPFATTTTGDGRIVLATSSANGRGRGAILTEGRATATFRAPQRLGTAETGVVLARAYLGDTALAAALPGGAIAVRLQRHYSSAFGPAVTISGGRGAVTALAVTLDYRGDALVAWERGGSVWARELHADGRRLSAQARLGPSGPRPQLQALVSDDNHAIVAWSSTRGAPGAATSTVLRLAISGPLLRFAARPLTLESFRDPAANVPGPGSLRLVRLSSEGVLLGWTAIQDGLHVVRAAVAGLDGLKPAATVSAPGGDAILSDLEPGPRGEAVALWTVAGDATARRTGTSPLSIDSARGSVGAGARVQFSAPATIAAVAPAAPAASPLVPALAIDPGSDTAIAAWRTGTGVVYARRPPGGGGAVASAAPGARGTTPSGGASLPWTLVAVALGAVVLALGAGRAAANRRRRTERALQ